MARRSRKRRRRPRSQPPQQQSGAAPESGGAVAEAERPRETARDRTHRQSGQRRYRDPEERPKAPWAPFPLVELVVLLALILLVGGFVLRGSRGTLMIGAGLVLGTVAGLELSIREHFTGYRSHTALLAGAVAIAILAGLTFLAPAVPAILRLVLAAGAFAGAAWFLVRVFQRRSGLSVKFR